MLGIVLGSLIESLPFFRCTEQRQPSTPFGTASSPLYLGTINEVPVVILQRHGAQNYIPAFQVNYPANVYSLLALGVSKVLSINAVGSLQTTIMPGSICLPGQMFSWHRKSQSFGNLYSAPSVPMIVRHFPFDNLV